MFRNLINTKLPSYRGRRLKAGEAFVAARGDAKLYVAAGLARYDTAEVVAAPKPAPTPKAKPAPNAKPAKGKKGQYNRRDMRAKD